MVLDKVTAYRRMLPSHWAGANDEMIRDYVRMQFLIVLCFCHGVDPTEANTRAIQAEIVLKDGPIPDDEAMFVEMPLFDFLRDEKSCLN